MLTRMRGAGADAWRSDGATTPLAAPLLPIRVPRFALVGIDGPATGQRWESQDASCSIGSEASNDFVIADRTVSRFHCTVVVEATSARLRDVGSLNGTRVDGVVVVECLLRPGNVVRVGKSALRFEAIEGECEVPASGAARFGSLAGTSAAMRRAFAMLERAAASSSTVLLEGETGTGKGAAAEAIHDASPRARGPFVVLDCGAIPRTLLESELFGHERGAFTGAERRHVGAVETASGGSLFLDEIGELLLELQPKLLRAIETHEIRPVGAARYRRVDVRIIAATHRDLRAEVNRNTFRADLYHRLAVLRIVLPPLRDRPEDVPLLVRALLASLGATPETQAPLYDDELAARLSRARWPGNVRELRNYLERLLVLGVTAESAAPPGAVPPYDGARSAALERFEREYLGDLLRAHGDNLSEAARAAGVSRVYLYRLLRRHRLQR